MDLQRIFIIDFTTKKAGSPLGSRQFRLYQKMWGVELFALIISIYLAVSFGTNSILSVVFIAAARRFKSARLGFRDPFSRRLMSA